MLPIWLPIVKPLTWDFASHMGSAMTERLKSQKKAEKARDARTEQVQVRFSKEEAAAIDAVRGDLSRPQWIKARVLAALRRKK